jgi:hypothetical protein
MRDRSDRAPAWAWVLLFAACQCGTPADSVSDGGPRDSGATQDSGTVVDGGASCSGPDGPCDVLAGPDCCAGSLCVGGFCSEQVTCRASGEACASPVDCCTGTCVSGTCGTVSCAVNGGLCALGPECCSGTCDAGTCTEVTGATCGTLYQTCLTGADCCSTNCLNGRCASAFSCQANGDLCFSDADCCGRTCSQNDGGAGLCQFITGGGGGGCLQGGNPCSSGTNCCSRVCADPGSGVSVCLPAGGCRLTGDSCNSDDECCGGGLNPNGSVLCINGRCDNGQSCNGVGNICGARVLPDGGASNASQNCCNGRKDVCQVDSSGIPRCFGGCPNNVCPSNCPNGFDGTAGCCIAGGDVCQFKDQCCSGAPCLPGPDGGVARCTISSCIPVGDTCNPSASNCCNGTVCLQSTELTWVCQSPIRGDGGTEPEPGPDGGTSDGGVLLPDGGMDGACRANGSSCDVAVQCCSSQCISGTCKAPGACQPQDGACSASADCCSGLACVFLASGTTGLCAPASCAGPGQPCSSALGCCTGLSCRDALGAVCAEGTACTCNVVIQ